jgi:hypothetical protein
MAFGVALSYLLSLLRDTQTYKAFNLISYREVLLLKLRGIKVLRKPHFKKSPNTSGLCRNSFNRAVGLPI